MAFTVGFALPEEHLPDGLPGFLLMLDAMACHPVVDAVRDGERQLLHPVQIIPELDTEAHHDHVLQGILGILAEHTPVGRWLALEIGGIAGFSSSPSLSSIISSTSFSALPLGKRTTP